MNRFNKIEWPLSSKNNRISNVTYPRYETKVFGANNVELVTRTRTEHLTEEDKKRAKSNKNPLQSFLGMAEVEVKQAAAAESDRSQSEFFSANNPCCISPAEYFDGAADLGERDIGRPKEMTCKVQKFQPQLWLCEDYPLSLQEQVRSATETLSHRYRRDKRGYATL